MKAIELLKISESLNEAAISVKEFSKELDKIKDIPAKGHKIYSFDFGRLVKHKDALDLLQEKGFADLTQDHMPNYISVFAGVNSDADPGSDDGWLWDASVNVVNGFIQVSGAGAPSGGDGSATLLYKTDGSLHSVESDKLKGIHIEEEHAYLEKIIIECSEALFSLLVKMFGPSVR